jgi:tRNA dimethylallyltransferase
LKGAFPKTVIIIAGPTAVGKTAIAIQLAQYFNTEIISADSRQFFKELNIAVARPSPAELSVVRHHFIASHSIQENITAADFEEFALQKTKELFKRHDTLILVGGTGLYIKAFSEGLDAIPSVEPEIRESIRKDYEAKGLSWLQEQIKQKDQEFYKQGEIQNPQRMMRALEVLESTGQSILSFRSNRKAERDFNIIKIGLELPKAKLNENINDRVDQMMKAGLLEEAREVLPYRSLNALQTVGYKELFHHFDGKISLQEAVEQIKLNTRQYAKRQMTWFKKDKAIIWFPPGAIDEIRQYLNEL